MFSLQSAVVLLAASGFMVDAAAVRTTDASSQLQQRDDKVGCYGSYKTNSPAIPKYSGFGWHVFIDQPIGLTGGKDAYCGDNFLGYMRAQSAACKTITSYTCTPVEDKGGKPVGIDVSFDTNIFCGAGQVQKAIWDSTSPKLPNQCSNTMSEAPDANDVVEAISGLIEAAGGEAVADKAIHR